MGELELADVYAAAARATINERCGLAYIHDLRGSMQALFSALELLGRSARAQTVDPERVEKACALAKRAINHHEKSTLEALEALTLQDPEATVLDLGALLHEVTHFLRNDAASRELRLHARPCADIPVRAVRAELRTLLVGLLAAAIDHAPHGSQLDVELDADEHEARVTIGSAAGYGAGLGPSMSVLVESAHREGGMHANDLTMIFAQRFLTLTGGRLEVDRASSAAGRLSLYYPLAG